MVDDAGRAPPAVVGRGRGRSGRHGRPAARRRHGKALDELTPRRYYQLRKKAYQRAVHDAIDADKRFTEAMPAPNTLQGLSFLGGFFNGASAPLIYELIAEVTFPFVGEAVSGKPHERRGGTSWRCSCSRASRC